MALRTYFNQPEIGYPRIAEFTVQRTEALFEFGIGEAVPAIVRAGRL